MVNGRGAMRAEAAYAELLRRVGGENGLGRCPGPRAPGEGPHLPPTGGGHRGGPPGPPARRAADFRRFRPWLERIVVLCRRYAAAVDSAADPYDVLLQYYEPDLTTARLTDLFDSLRRELVPLAHALAYAPRRPDTSILTR